MTGLAEAVLALADEWECEPAPSASHISLCPDCCKADLLRAFVAAATAETPRTPECRSDHLLDGSPEAVAVVRHARGMPAATPRAYAEHDTSMCSHLHPGKTHQQSIDDLDAAFDRRDRSAAMQDEDRDAEETCHDCGHALSSGRHCRSVGMCRCGFNHTRRDQ